MERQVALTFAAAYEIDLWSQRRRRLHLLQCVNSTSGLPRLANAASPVTFSDNMDHGCLTTAAAGTFALIRLSVLAADSRSDIGPIRTLYSVFAPDLTGITKAS